MNRTTVLSAVLIASALWVVTTILGGAASDRFGRRRVLRWGSTVTFVWSAPLFLAVGSTDLFMIAGALIVLTVPLGLMHGPQVATLAEAFPTEVRFSGASVAYAAASILGAGSHR